MQAVLALAALPSRTCCLKPRQSCVRPPHQHAPPLPHASASSSEAPAVLCPSLCARSHAQATSAALQCLSWSHACMPLHTSLAAPHDDPAWPPARPLQMLGAATGLGEAQLGEPLHVRVVGSYVRGKADCGDIDFIVAAPPAAGEQHPATLLYQLIQKLVEAGELGARLHLVQQAAAGGRYMRLCSACFYCTCH
jgi:hypothetical protein